MAALAAMAMHIVHVAVTPIIQPLLQLTFSLLKIDIADAQLLKTELLTPTQNVGFELA